MSVTIKDIARIINVSHTTVSRALNDSPLISNTTKEKVRRIAEKYNYRPNVRARSLVLAKTYTIGLFFSTINRGTSPNFFLDSVRGVNRVVKDMFNLSVEGLDDFKDFSKISSSFFDGILLMSQSTDDDRFIKHVEKAGIPFVLLNRETHVSRVMSILADDTTGAYIATEHLINNGHDRIGIIEGKPEFRTTYRRKEGFMNALKDHNLRFNPKYSAKGNFDIESGYTGMHVLLGQNLPPTAVFCLNDDMAVGAMKAAYEKKLKIPEDISLIGFDDSIFAMYLNPSLSSVRRPIEDMSAEGARILLDMIGGEEIKKETIFLHTELKKRESVMPLTA